MAYLKRLFVAMFVVFASEASAVAWSTQGGETLDTSINAIDVGTGYPWALQARYHLPIQSGLEIMPGMGLYYGQATTVPMVGTILSVGVKGRLLSSKQFHLSLMADPGFVMNFHPGIFLFGLSLGLPQVLCTYNVDRAFSIHFGMRMPITVIFGRRDVPTFAWIPILAHVGMEYGVSTSINIFAKMDMGVSITATKDGSASDFYPSFLLGAAFRF